MKASGEFVQFYRAIANLSTGANYRPKYWTLQPDKSDLLKVLFDRLTQREKQVLILRVGFDYDYEEIGEILGITPKRAKDYIRLRLYHHTRHTGRKRDTARVLRPDRDAVLLLRRVGFGTDVQ